MDSARKPDRACGGLVIPGLAGAALLVLASCGGGASPSRTPAPTPPSGLFEFAETIDRALVLGDTDLTERTKFATYICPGNYFPAAGPNCTESAQGEGVYAIDIGAYGSEGDIYDAPSYGRYLTDWIYDALREASDEFGSGAPRVYAIADMPPEIEGFQGELGTYAVIATRIAKSPVDATPRRDVLTFFVAGSAHGWLITSLLRSPPGFLDPGSPEAAGVFTSWERWARPAPAGNLASRWKSGRGSRQLAYLDSSGTLTVASADGSSRQTAATGVCGGAISGKNEIAWSLDARLVAVACPGAAQGRSNIEIYRSDGAGLQGVVENVASYAWSPDGHRIAYQTLDTSGGALMASVRLRDPDSGDDSLVRDDAILLDWPRPDEMLLGLNPVSQSGAYFETYEANFYNLTTGATARVQRFDNQAQFWMAPPGDKAIVLGKQITRKDSPGWQLAVYDIATGDERPLPGLAIAYGSESIPRGNVVVVPGGGAGFIWADYAAGGVYISASSPDGSHAELLERLKGDVYSISADGMILYIAGPDGPPGLTIRDPQSGAETNWPDAITGSIAPAGD